MRVGQYQMAILSRSARAYRWRMVLGVLGGQPNGELA
jgi:hypothetical protein